MPKTKRDQKVIYKTNVGSIAYHIIKNGRAENARFHVLRKPKNKKCIPIFSGPHFGEACYNLFQDGFSHAPTRLKQGKLKSITQTSL